MSVVFTVGYEATDIDRFIATLKNVGIKQVADVRAVAVSRKKGFSKTRLAERLASEGIDYLHLIDLGDPKPGREAARAGDLVGFKVIYNSHLENPAPQLALDTLENYVSTDATCLLCFERDPATCHRTVVANHMESRLGWITFHLFADEPLRYVRHADKLPRFNPCKGLTAAE